MDSQDEILNDVKTARGYNEASPIASEDEAQLKLYIKLASKSMALFCGEDYTKMPGELTGVVTEMALAKFAKRGNEGKTSAGEEGLTDSWNVDDLAPYISQLNQYNNNKASNGAGLNGDVMMFD